MKYKTLEEIIQVFQSEDELAVPLATGQPYALLQALGNRTEWKALKIFSGLLTSPYPWMGDPRVSMTSGYYGPLERMLNESGARIDYLPASFSGFEYFVRKKPYRITAVSVSTPDDEGYVTLGTHCGASYRPFLEACQDPKRIAIAEINPSMPHVYGHPDFGDNKVALKDISFAFEAESPQMVLPPIDSSDVESKIADHVVSLLQSKDTLQFGIGGIPNLIADKLATSPLNDFGVHSELVSDGFLKLIEAGKISNRYKGVFENQSVFTFAFGSQPLYDFLDERKGRNKRQAIALPVTIVNAPHMIGKNKNMVSINSCLMIDFAGQVCSESIGYKQYSGVGGQLSFVEGAYEAEQGKSIFCMKSTATVDGQLISNILPTFPAGAIVSTPRHFIQYVVTEYGVVDLYGVPDEKRPEKLISIAHPQFRDSLSQAYEELKKKYYHASS